MSYSQLNNPFSSPIQREKPYTAGMSAAEREAHNKETGGNVQAPQPEGGPRKDSYCARSAKIKKCKDNGGRVIAVGTTSVRSLESCALDREFSPYSGETNIFIYPGFEFKIVDALITNFHLPASSLVMLVSAFSTKDILLNAYKEAIANNYRFYSYGDAMFIRK